MKTKKAFCTFEVKSVKKNDSGKRIFTGIASTPTPDLMQDVVEPKGAQFKLPLPLLWQHDHKDPIGWITKAIVTKNGIEVEGEVADIPEEGPLKNRLSTAWQMLKNKLVRGLSIGFKVLEYSWIEGTDYGMHISKWIWNELSAVTIPANQEATILAIKAASGHYTNPGASGNKTKGVKTMNLRQKLKQLLDERETKVARLGELTDLIKSHSASGDETAEFDQLTIDIEKADNDIRLVKSEIVMAEKAEPVSPVVRTAPTVIIKKTDADEKFKGQNYTRKVIAKALAHIQGISPILVAEKRWGRTNPQLVEIIKTDIAGGGTESGEWGAQLVQADARYTGDFIEFLKSMTVFDRLGLREVPANVTIKGQSGIGTGYWIGQSKAIKPSAQVFTSVSLTPLKVAALAVVSNELLRDSSPAAEQLVRDALAEASAQRIDTTFLSTDIAVSNVSPAGMLWNVTPESSEGVTAAGLRADVKALYATFIAAKNAGGLKFVMNPALAKAIQLMVNSLGLVEFPGINQNGGNLLGDDVVTGDNVNANHLILLKPSDIYRIADTGIEVSISREAMIEQHDAPTGATDSPAAASGKFTSMFQEESTAIKVVRPINFAKRRSGVVQYVSDADYSAVVSS